MVKEQAGPWDGPWDGNIRQYASGLIAARISAAGEWRWETRHPDGVRLYARGPATTREEARAAADASLRELGHLPPILAPSWAAPHYLLAEQRRVEILTAHAAGLGEHPTPPDPAPQAPPEKIRWTFMPWRALALAAEVVTRGDSKHPGEEWRSMDPDLHYDAVIRHLTAWRTGTAIDPEWGLPHLAHALVRLGYLLTLTAYPEERT